MVFSALSVKVCREITSTGKMSNCRPSAGGTRLSPVDFHAALSAASPSTVALLDVRNHYETGVGLFRDALDPKLRCFSQFPEFVEENLQFLRSKQRVLMYCTGGIRCEKASAYLRSRGIDNVGQLHGGIHKYMEAFPDGGYFRGKNFVFDQRKVMGSQDETIVGRCCYCCAPYDEYSDEVVCSVCRDLVLVCPDCRAQCLAAAPAAAPAAATTAADVLAAGECNGASSTTAPEGSSPAAAELEAAAAAAVAESKVDDGAAPAPVVALQEEAVSSVAGGGSTPYYCSEHRLLMAPTPPPPMPPNPPAPTDQSRAEGEDAATPPPAEAGAPKSAWQSFDSAQLLQFHSQLQAAIAALPQGRGRRRRRRNLHAQLERVQLQLKATATATPSTNSSTPDGQNGEQSSGEIAAAAASPAAAADDRRDVTAAAGGGASDQPLLQQEWHPFMPLLHVRPVACFATASPTDAGEGGPAGAGATPIIAS